MFRAVCLALCISCGGTSTTLAFRENTSENPPSPCGIERTDCPQGGGSFESGGAVIGLAVIVGIATFLNWKLKN